VSKLDCIVSFESGTLVSKFDVGRLVNKKVTDVTNLQIIWTSIGYREMHSDDIAIRI
jgi:hypothetical protein